MYLFDDWFTSVSRQDIIDRILQLSNDMIKINEEIYWGQGDYTKEEKDEWYLLWLKWLSLKNEIEESGDYTRLEKIEDIAHSAAKWASLIHERGIEPKFQVINKENISKNENNSKNSIHFGTYVIIVVAIMVAMFVVASQVTSLIKDVKGILKN